MTALETLRNMGNCPWKSSPLSMAALPADARAEAVSLVRDHKAEIVRTLQCQKQQLQHLAEVQNRNVMLTREREDWDAQNWGPVQ
jgi:hypothetical protein